MLPAWQVEGLLEYYADYQHGEASEVTGVVEEVTARPAIPSEQFARDSADQFTST